MSGHFVFPPSLDRPRSLVPAWTLTGATLSSLLAGADVLAVLVTGLVCRRLNPLGHTGHTLREILVILATGALVAWLIQERGLYRRPMRGETMRLQQALAPALSAFAFVVLALLVWDGIASLATHAPSLATLANRNWLCAWALLSPSAVLALHAVLHPWTWEHVAGAEHRRRAIIIGGGDHVRHLAAHLAENPQDAFRVVGFLPTTKGARALALPTWSLLRDLLAVRDTIRAGDVDLIVIALPGAASWRIREIVGRMSALPIDIRLAPDLGSFHFRNARVSSICGLPFLHLRDRPISGTAAAIKRAEDLALAAAFLLLLAPLMTLIACAIRLDSAGPVFFNQPRLGFNHRLIRVRKFRTMRPGAQDLAGCRQAVRDDPRVTRIGRLLRRTSLDELPQLFNVIRGDMSLIGPRPHALGTEAAGQPFDKAVADYAARHRVKPGITGWAQVHGWRGETDTVEKLRQRVAHDMYYIDNWSILLDLRVLAMTAPSLWSEQAY
ncbi:MULTISPECIES: undecaprenyl-phosphate glucose phosphotransferase [unclassified Acidisoma]|jgi:Undecaprenyl-phosphate glucose phosphotransferase|uniref:undecaprenyl-phosphate glucose phosphotransferase n=1 Tax=unclassified Acidisoma TaxID=2634065 RepID=UPI00131BF0DA|nr:MULTISPECIES: undecaprenyl-phosphate glucose phosphotransferase [unclassified Acidisoma]